MLKVTLFEVIIEFFGTNKTISALIWSCLIRGDHCTKIFRSATKANQTKHTTPQFFPLLGFYTYGGFDLLNFIWKVIPKMYPIVVLNFVSL